MTTYRITFEKTGRARYISHLDLMRCMQRALKRSGLPVWYTEGFSPRIAMNFAVPLSLGFESPRESMDIRLLEDVEKEDLLQRLNAGLPEDIRAFDVTEPVMVVNDVAFAEYRLTFTGEGVYDALQALLAREEIIVMKHSKKGDKPVDIRPHFADIVPQPTENGCEVICALPAGNFGGINPMLLGEALKNAGCPAQLHVERRTLLNGEKQLFV